MRPPAQPQSALRNPLNTILGREANVRILRVLSLDSVPVARADLARLAQLQPRGMKKLLDSLEDAGVVEAVSRGRQQSYRLSHRLSLTNVLRNLYAEERSRAQQVFDGIKQLAASQGPAVKAAWIEGPVATGTDRTGDSLVLTVLAAHSADEPMRLSLREGLNAIQAQFDVPIELRLMYQADLEALTLSARAELNRAQPVSGPPPRHFLEPAGSMHASPSGGRADAVRDAQLLDRARTLAEKIARDPSVIERARRWIEGRIPVASPGEKLELTEWLDILNTMSPSRVRRLLTQPGERATRLRQSMPFVEESR